MQYPNFFVDKIIQQSVPRTEENIHKIVSEQKEILSNMSKRHLRAAEQLLRKVIQWAELELQISENKQWAGSRLEGLYIAESYVNTLLHYKEKKG